MEKTEKQAEKTIRKYDLDKKTFTNKKCPTNLHFFFVVGEMPFKPMKSYFKTSHSLTCFDIQNGHLNWWWCDQDIDRLQKFFIKKALKNPKILNDFKKEYDRRAKIFNKESEKIFEKDLTELSYNSLFDFYENWYQAYKNFHGLANSFHDVFTMHPEKWIEPELRKYIKNKKDFTKIYLALISLVEETFETEEYKERLKLVKFIDSKKFEKKLVAHEKQWHWLRNNYAVCIYLDKEYFRKEVEKLKSVDVKAEFSRFKKELELIKKTKKILIKKFKLPKKAKLFIRIAEEFGFMQDDRKRCVMPATYYQNIFMQEFGKRLGLSKKDMEYTYIHELKDLKNKKIGKDFFSNRRKCTMVINAPRGYEIFSGKLALKIYEKIFKKNVEFNGELKGQPASMGYAKGTVKIVTTIKNILEVKEGDIIVASMTKPDTLPAMMKAAAIITDEGGITSHAAIISRELKIPCIIGTKIATKVLRDGDLVEVDANKGVIKIIKN